MVQRCVRETAEAALSAGVWRYSNGEPLGQLRADTPLASVRPARLGRWFVC